MGETGVFDNCLEKNVDNAIDGQAKPEKTERPMGIILSAFCDAEPSVSGPAA